MSTLNTHFTEPSIVTSHDLNKRSYVTFYYNNERVREYNANCIGLRINPNRAKAVDERNQLLKKLCFEIHKALDDNRYRRPSGGPELIDQPSIQPDGAPRSTISLLFESLRTKLRSDLSRTYKRDLKTIYRAFRTFMSSEELNGPILAIPTARIEKFLAQYGSSGTYYMNKRRNLGVLFSSAGRLIDKQIKSVRETPRRKSKARLHEKYDKAQLMPILEFLKEHYPNLYLCCLLTYGSWLRPHEEVRLLQASDFRNDLSEIHLSGDENKGGKVRVVYIPEYTRTVIAPIVATLTRNDNIFSLSTEPFNYSYFNTQWSRAYARMYTLGLVYDNQTIYSFRHTAAVELYRKTKDVYLLQKLLGHSNIVVTLKYLRSLGEVDTNGMREAAPSLYAL